MGRQAKIKKQRREHREQTKDKIIDAYQKSDVASFIERELDVELYAYQRYFINKFAKWGFKRG